MGSVLVAFECLLRFTPHVFLDSTGYAFTYVVARWFFGCTVVAYTHYPTISTDMLDRVRERRPTYNNTERVAGNAVARCHRLSDYVLDPAHLWQSPQTCLLPTICQALCPGWSSGRHCDGELHLDQEPHQQTVPGEARRTNPGSHTRAQIPSRTSIVYPPCNTTTLQRLPHRLVTPSGATQLLCGRERLVISIGQFRPEKDHMLQLRAFHQFLNAPSHPPAATLDTARDTILFAMIGGCRNEGDKQRIEELQAEARRLGIQVKKCHSRVTYLDCCEINTVSGAGAVCGELSVR